MPSKLPPSTQGQTVPAGTARDLGRFLQAPQKDPGRMASPQPAGKSAKACAGTGNKGRAGPFFTYITVNDFKEQEQEDCGHFHFTRSSWTIVSGFTQEDGLLLKRRLDGVHHLLHPLQVEPGRPRFGYVLLFQDIHLCIVS